MSHRTKNRPPPPEAIGLPLVIFLLIMLVGVALAYILVRGFVFHHGDQYWALAWPAFLILLPVITIVLLASEKGKQWRHRFSLARVPHAVAWGLGIIVFDVLMICSPFGYIALFNEVVGYDVAVNAKVVSVWDEVQQPGRKKPPCMRNAVIQFEGRTKRICLMDYYKPNDNIEGADVLLKIRRSSFGYSIGQMTLAR